MIFAIYRFADVARQMVPGRTLAIKTAIRLSIAALLFALAHQVSGVASGMVMFVAKFYVMFTVFGLIGHSESVFSSHAAAWVENQLARRHLVDDPDFDPMVEIDEAVRRPKVAA